MSLNLRLPGDQSARDAKLLAAQLELLTGVMAGQDLGGALDTLLRVVEEVSSRGLLASVLLLDQEGTHLLHAAAPSLPEEYNAAIHGVAIGPSVGSCGTAAYRRRQVIVEDIAHDPLWADYKHLALAAGLRACWSTPIFGAGGKVLGTFAMYYPRPHAPSSGDLALIGVLVRTVAMAVDHSQHDEERERELALERDVALTFQRSLLPQVPTRIGTVELAARYRTGDPGVRVGGDWFDAVAVDDGIVLVVGDVQGHDVRAAALMGQLRTVVRATAAEAQPPASVLARTAAYLERLQSDLLATVLVVHLDVDSRLVTTACAGHLPPVALTASGSGLTTTSIEVETGPPLGVAGEWPERSTRLPSGTTLLLYTDGLVETRTWDIDEGVGALGTLLEDLPADASPDAVLDSALGLLPAGCRGDDVAALAARIPQREAAPVPTAERWLPSQSMSVPLARSWAEGWLRTSAVPCPLVEPTLLVVSEMVTNAIAQGDDPVRVALGLDGGAVLVEVFDTGHRLPLPSARPPEATSGRGLRIIEALSDRWGIREELSGKTVWAVLSETASQPPSATEPEADWRGEPAPDRV